MVYKATHLSTVLWDHAELLCFYHFNQCQMNVKNWPKGCRHSLVDLSATSILPPQVQLPSTPSMLLSFIIIFVLYLSLQCETRTKINKRGWVWAIFYKRIDQILQHPFLFFSANFFFFSFAADPKTGGANPTMVRILRSTNDFSQPEIIDGVSSYFQQRTILSIKI